MTQRLEDEVNPATTRTRLVPGYAGEGSSISIGGLLQPAIWLQHVEARLGDPIQILLIERKDNPGLAVVVGVSGKFSPGITQPREGTVTTAPTGSDTVEVSTVGGATDATLLASYTPAIGDRVRLLWQAGEATILGKVGATPPKPPKPEQERQPTPAPPPKGGGGPYLFAAADSATWSTGTGSWNSYFKSDLYQGYYGTAKNNRGAWFYHEKPGKLKGRTVTSVQIWVPPRSSAGNYNSSVTLHLFLHSSSRRPGGDVNRSAHTTINIPRRFKGGWKTLPTSWGAALIGGDGIGMSGGSYAGFSGIRKTGKSGQLSIRTEG